MIDTTKLRELAQNAAPGPWTQWEGRGWVHAGTPEASATCYLAGIYGQICRTDCGDFSDAQEIKNAEYIAAANPATVLALLDKLDAPEPEPVARVTGYYAGYLSIETADGRVLPAGTALYAAPPHQSEQHLEMVNAPTPSVPDADLVIDLKHVAYDALTAAAMRSKWIPPEYVSNDWIADCINFLENGHPAVPAELVAAAEREECVKVCDDYAVDQWNLYKGRHPYTGEESGRADPETQGQCLGAEYLADAIRARGEKGQS